MQEQKADGYDIGDSFIDILYKQRKDKHQTTQLSKQKMQLEDMTKKNSVLEVFLEKREL